MDLSIKDKILLNQYDLILDKKTTPMTKGKTTETKKEIPNFNQNRYSSSIVSPTR
jgi:hypothetical protein